MPTVKQDFPFAALMRKLGHVRFSIKHFKSHQNGKPLASLKLAGCRSMGAKIQLYMLQPIALKIAEAIGAYVLVDCMLTDDSPSGL